MRMPRDFLAAPVLIGALLLCSAGQAHAQTVIVENGNVLAIEGLPVAMDGGVELYDVTFRFDTADSVYGEDPVFDFMITEDAVAALAATIDALNATSPVPIGAGPEGTLQFFIGSEVENGLIVALGSEIVRFSSWVPCQIDCIAGSRFIRPSEPFTYADFAPADGEPPTGPTGKSLAVDYGPFGLYAFSEAAGFERLSRVDPEFFVSFDGGLAVDFGAGRGLWLYDNTGQFSQLGTGDPDNTGNTMVAFNGGLAIDYGSAGLWLWNPAFGFISISTTDPQHLAVVDGQLAADLGTAGLWLFDPTTGAWKRLGTGDPDNTGSTMDEF